MSPPGQPGFLTFLKFFSWNSLGTSKLIEPILRRKIRPSYRSLETIQIWPLATKFQLRPFFPARFAGLGKGSKTITTKKTKTRGAQTQT